MTRLEYRPRCELEALLARYRDGDERVTEDDIIRFVGEIIDEAVEDLREELEAELHDLRIAGVIE